MTAGAHQQSAVVRSARATVRRALLDGATTIEDVLRDPPDCILTMTIIDVLRFLRRDRSANRWEHHLGQHAVRDRVNVFVRVGDASDRTIEWAIEHGQWHAINWRVRKTTAGGVA